MLTIHAFQSANGSILGSRVCRVGVYGFISRVSSGFKVLDQYDLNDTILQVRVCCAFRPGCFGLGSLAGLRPGAAILL